jgi:SAM-dependent methyltransferase
MNLCLTPGRDDAALRRHYLIERELADRLRSAGAHERKALYRVVYDELFQRVPDHPQLTRKDDPAQREARNHEQLGLLRSVLSKDSVFIEIGAGDCHLTMSVAAEVRQAYAIDVSETVSAGTGRPANFRWLLSDGVAIPLPSESVDVAYSNMLLEHLHPEDAVQHAREVHRVLKPGGVYVCRTPHRFSGPQDISQYFDDEATGFHLKEYAFAELCMLFRGTGFRTVSPRLRIKRRNIWLPKLGMRLAEGLLAILPRPARRWLAASRTLRPLFGTITVHARKPK